MEDILNALHYEPETGVFTWVNPIQKKHLGKVAGGSKNRCGYVHICYRGKYHAAHRIAFAWMGHEVPKYVDHINRNRADNRWVNLRPANSEQNGWNQGIRKNNTSGFKGVSFIKKIGKFRAMIRYKGKQKALGDFATAAEAGAAYEKASRDFHGEYSFSEGRE